MSDQLLLDMRELWVVRNYWGPVLHVQYTDGMTAWYDEQPSSFPTLCAALEFCRMMGRMPDQIFTLPGESYHYRSSRAYPTRK